MRRSRRWQVASSACPATPAFETFSVLTRLPGPQRLSPAAAHRLLAATSRAPGIPVQRRRLPCWATSAVTGWQGERCMTHWWPWRPWSTAPSWSAG
jgi:hypothetical protein